MSTTIPKPIFENLKITDEKQKKTIENTYAIAQGLLDKINSLKVESSSKITSEDHDKITKELTKVKEDFDRYIIANTTVLNDINEFLKKKGDVNITLKDDGKKSERSRKTKRYKRSRKTKRSKRSKRSRKTRRKSRK